jgi:hypothetical protein
MGGECRRKSSKLQAPSSRETGQAHLNVVEKPAIGVLECGFCSAGAIGNSPAFNAGIRSGDNESRRDG